MVTVRLARSRTGPASVGSLLLSAEDAAALAVKGGDEVRIGLGKWTGRAVVDVGPGRHATLHLPAGASRLPVRSLALYSVGPGRLRLGPLIGILVMYRVSARAQGIANGDIPRDHVPCP